MAFGIASPAGDSGGPPSASKLFSYGKPAQGQGRAASGAPRAEEYVPGEVLVRFGVSVASTARAEAHARFGARSVKELRGAHGVEKVELSSKMTVDEAVKAYAAVPGVVSVQPNYLYHLTSIPNDSQFGELWGMDNQGQTGGTPDADIDAPAAWDIQTGDEDVVVAVIDTGVDYNHPDLAANMWVNEGEIPGNGIDDDENGFVDDVYGYDFANYDGDPMDDNAHGTHCAGTIGAVGDNGIGVAGVAWNVQIMAVKFLTADGWGTSEAAIEAIAYADMMGARVLSNSWGGGGYDRLLYETISAVNGLFVAAAGNDSMDTDSMPFYPACYDLDNIISVGATDHDDNVAWFSNFGRESVDLFAPGDMILSTVPGQPPRFVPDVGATLMSDDLSSFDDWDTTQYNSQPWELSSENYTSAPTSAAHVGYRNSEDSWLKRAVPVDLSSVSSALLGFKALYDLEWGFDQISAHVSTNTVDWLTVGSVTGWSAGEFEQHYYDISALAGEPEVYVAFSLTSDEYVDSLDGYVGGWIDDVEVVEANVLFSDAMSDLDNWDNSEYAVNPWLLTDEFYASPPSAAGHVFYSDNEDSWLKLVSPLDLSGVADGDVALRFRAFYETEPGLDAFRVWASTDGTSWDQIAQYTGWSWEYFPEYAIDVSAYAGEPSVYIAFSFESDSSVSDFLGAVVDDVSVAVGTWTDPGHESAYDWFSGTSMAAPHVSGLAALALSQKPGLTTELVKWSLMDTVDVLPSLSGSAVTEGRINAHSAMLDHWAPVLTDDIAQSYEASASITITATDDTGVEHITYRFDDRPWVRVEADTAQAIFAVPGARSMTYYASDVLGNETQPTTLEFGIVRGAVSHVSVAGETRYLTAIEASKRAFPNGADAVVLATGVAWPDALGGTALAGAAGGPVLLTKPAELMDVVADEIARLAPSKIYVLGGVSALSEGVERGLAEAAGEADIVRIAGDTRYDTASQVADEVISILGDAYDGTAFVATGRRFPDALGASPLAAAQGWPILLAGAPTGGIELPEQVRSCVILGGPMAVGDGIQAALEARLGESQVTRRGGIDRYGTAALVAALGVNRGMYWEGVGIATGANFPDALSGGAMLGERNAVMLLTPGTSLSEAARDPLMLNKELIQTVDYLGGLSALSQPVRDGVRDVVE